MENTELRSGTMVLVRNKPSDRWKVDIFSYLDYEEYKGEVYRCIGGNFTDCIPFHGNGALAGEKRKEPTRVDKGFAWGERVRVWRSGDFAGEAEALFVSKEADGYWVLTKGCLGATRWEHCERI